MDEIKRIEKELEDCKDYEIPELGIKIGYNPLWCMMDGKKEIPQIIKLVGLRTTDTRWLNP